LQRKIKLFSLKTTGNYLLKVVAAALVAAVSALLFKMAWDSGLASTLAGCMVVFGTYLLASLALGMANNAELPAFLSWLTPRYPK
jgi:hypothetical protein